MGKRLYIGNLSFSVNDAELNLLFSEIGPVESARVITDRRSGRSKGYGFVEMKSDEDATKAIAQYDGGELEGRILKVSEAKALPPAEATEPPAASAEPESQSPST